MKTEIEKIEREALALIKTDLSLDEIQACQARYLGRKGLVTGFLRNISSAPKEDRPELGRIVNKVKKSLEQAFAKATKRHSSKGAGFEEGLDVTLPGRPLLRGTIHPIIQITRKINDIFLRLGFEILEGPDIESDYYNFEALNLPKDHPARDMQDTFYISDNVVLRTHTSPIQIRAMEKQQPPIRMIGPGKAYRVDYDISHTPMFQQVEGLMVDKGVSFGDLKGILTIFVHQMFDETTSLRFRPSFFPFTEPSAEVDIECVMCRGKGCRICSHTGWLEILGAGMVDPAVFTHVGYDAKRYTGLAFGMGIERIAMLKYGIEDIRKLYENDIRFLHQF
ncbi:MAG: phenylalanine--tRNA ligase subunit alpha [Desulfobacteria bacterium]